MNSSVFFTKNVCSCFGEIYIWNFQKEKQPTTGNDLPITTVVIPENENVEKTSRVLRSQPFTLNTPDRHWIFAGDLCRVEGRSVRSYWALLFSDILLFTKVSRDRVLFVTDEPLPLSSIVRTQFSVKKKGTCCPPRRAVAGPPTFRPIFRYPFPN